MNYFHFSFAKRKFIINASKYWGIFSVFVLLFILDLYKLNESWKTANFSMFLHLTSLELLFSVLIIILLILIIGVGGYALLRKLTDKKMDEYLTNYENAHKGDKAEVQVHEYLSEWLSSQDYTVYPNYKIPDLRSDLDFVIVGPKGVILLEIKNYDTKNVFDENYAYYVNKEGKLIRLKYDIRKTVGWRAEKLEELLLERGLKNVHVYKVIVYTNSDSISFKNRMNNKYKVFVVQGMDNLKKYLTEKNKENQYTEEFCRKINVELIANKIYLEKIVRQNAS